MKKLSHKDLIIALGIAVAAIIVVSSIYFKETPNENLRAKKPATEKKLKRVVFVKKVLEKFAFKTRI